MTDLEFMNLAIEQAKQGLFSTHPNPRVGCVIVKDGQVIGQGAHIRAGEPHAEVYALRDAGEQARGATAYVTLEPCAHYGRTPPCAKGLIDAGVARVVVGMTDPFEHVAGKGMAMLEAAGIEVVRDFAVEPCEALNPGFLKWARTGLPFVRCKLAASLDGGTAMSNGESKWITGTEARSDVQLWRAQSSVVLTGIETLLADQARLAVRSEMWHDSRELVAPKRAVIDSQLRLPLDAPFLQDAAEVLVFTLDSQGDKASALRELGAEVIALPDAENLRVDLDQVVAWLGEHHYHEVLLESGASLAGGFAEAGLIDEYVFYLAPVLLGSDTRPLLNMSLGSLAEKHQLEIRDVTQVGGDLRIVARVV